MNEIIISAIFKKVKLGEQLYLLRPTENIIPSSDFDEDYNLIYEGKKIPCCLNANFLETDKKYCHGMNTTNLDLLDQYQTDSYEVALKKYMKDIKTGIHLVYYSNKLNGYQIMSLNKNDFDIVSTFVDFTYVSRETKEDDLGLVLALPDTITLDSNVYKQLNKLVVKQDFETLKKVWSPLNELIHEAAEWEKEEVVEQETNKVDLTIEQLIEQLNELIGLDNIKLEIEKLVSYLTFISKTNEYTNIESQNLNMVFTGNPGTGKTTVARLITLILYKLGYLKTNKIKECTSKDFIAEYVGQTAVKTAELIKEYKGGLIFVDEAYSFASEGGTYAQEALAEILKEMEKKETVFIFSGYHDEMEKFIKSNSGLTSRIGGYFKFEDYSKEQLFEMFRKKVNKSKLILAEECEETILSIIDRAKSAPNFGNGRFVDNLFDTILKKHALNNKDIDDKQKLITITLNDIDESFLQQLLYNSKQKTIGFIK